MGITTSGAPSESNSGNWGTDGFIASTGRNRPILLKMSSGNHFGPVSGLQAVGDRSIAAVLASLDWQDFYLNINIHWFLHRYFVQADLRPSDYSFLNLFEDTELQGYQLHRFKTELEIARVDLSARSGSVRVLTGWLGDVRSLDAEDWKTVQVEEITQIVSQLLELVAEAESTNKLLFAMGD